MELTREQISEYITEKTTSFQGLQELMTVVINSLMKHERTAWQQTGHEAANGFRARTLRYQRFEFALQTVSVSPLAVHC